MATTGLSQLLKGMPKQATAALAKQFAGMDIATFGKIRVFPKGTPYPDEFVISVLPKTPEDAKKLIDALIKRPGSARWEVFPYGILNPEIARIDIGVR